MAILPYNSFEDLEVGTVTWPQIFNANAAKIDEGMILRDILANRPAFGTADRLFYSTDTNEIYYDDSTQWVLVTSPGALAKNDIIVGFAIDAQAYVSDNLGATYAAVGSIFFRGTSAIGTPTNIKVIVDAQTSSPAHSIRIFDFTNSLVVAEVTGRTTTGVTILDLGALSNLPTGESLFEIQMKRDAGGSIDVRLHTAAILF